MKQHKGGIKSVASPLIWDDSDEMFSIVPYSWKL